MQEEIVYQTFNSERNALFIMTINRIIILNLSQNVNQEEEEENVIVHKVGGKDTIMFVGNSIILFNYLRLDNNLTYFVENDR